MPLLELFWAVRLIFDFCLYCRNSLLFTVLGFVILQSMPPEDSIKLSWLCYLILSLRLAVLLRYSAPVLRLSVGEGWRRNNISPEGQYLPDGEMWFSEPLVDWYEQYWSPSHWSYFLPHLSTANRFGLTLHYCEEERMRDYFFILWYPGRGRATYAPVLLISVYEGFGEPHLPVR